MNNKLCFLLSGADSRYPNSRNAVSHQRTDWPMPLIVYKDLMVASFSLVSLAFVLSKVSFLRAGTVLVSTVSPSHPKISVCSSWDMHHLRAYGKEKLRSHIIRTGFLFGNTFWGRPMHHSAIKSLLWKNVKPIVFLINFLWKNKRTSDALSAPTSPTHSYFLLEGYTGEKI